MSAKKEHLDALRFDLVLGEKFNESMKVKSAVLWTDAYLTAAREYGKNPRPNDVLRMACERLDIDSTFSSVRQAWYRAKGLLKHDESEE